MPLSSVLGAQSLVRPGVCTSSTRPASPYDGQVIYETDTNRTLVFNGSTWDIISVGVFTSSTRPSGAYEGQLIYETDTDLVKSYNGSSWVTVGPTTVPAAAVSAVGYAQVLTYQTHSSTSYTDLATVGPSVTLTTGTTAVVIGTAWLYDVNNDGVDNYISCAVSGASTVSASDNWAGYVRQDQNLDTGTFIYQFTGLTAGSNTFTMKYRKSGGTTAGASNRYLVVFAG